MTSLRSIADSFLGKQPFTLLQVGQTSVKFEADAIVSESYNKSSSVTTYPTEQGNDIAEHAMSNGFTISVSGVVSDASLSYFNLIEDVRSSSLGGLFGATSKSQAAFDQLDKWHDESQPLQVKCHFAKDGFRNKLTGAPIPWMIESLTIPRNKNTGSALRYNMTLRMIRQVTIGQLSLTSLAFAIDKGAQLLKAGAKSDSVSQQRTILSLTEDKTRASQLLDHGNLTYGVL